MWLNTTHHKLRMFHRFKLFTDSSLTYFIYFFLIVKSPKYTVTHRKLTLILRSVFFQTFFSKEVATPYKDYQHWRSYNPKFTTSVQLSPSSFHYYQNKYKPFINDLTMTSLCEHAPENWKIVILCVK